ncbi:hypothetical protein [Curtobacterium sp. MCBD17_003]|uniref:hypothetical protein n=1 Tax=Curtobacterium sp. MCBD17_003 TaxID=2175667 RepID=UPI000DA74AD2|nr:hypothetical protein [Curtobacterium sp. MCBD17_003]WIE55394.1 hypothetical protein DEI88_004070 [Curtobacterium sp. MCBD17_003]
MTETATRTARDNPDELATRGHFSERYYGNMRKALETAADLTEHVVSMITVATRGDDEVSGTKDAPLPFNTTAFNDANTLYATLVMFTRLWADRLRRQAPAPAKGAWTNSEGRVVGLPADIEPHQARYAVSIMATWLVAHLEDICWQEPADVEYMSDELRTVWAIKGRWPTRRRAYWSPLPCPTDGGRVAVYPAESETDTESAACSQCGRQFTADEYRAYVRAHNASRAVIGDKAAAKELRLSERTKNRLLAKYGRTS